MADAIRKRTVELNPDEEVVLGTPGGGFGSALDRDPAAVQRDVSEGFVSVTQARNAYGVVIRRDASVDRSRTDLLRRTMRSKQDSNA